MRCDVCLLQWSGLNEALLCTASDSGFADVTDTHSLDLCANCLSKLCLKFNDLLAQMMREKLSELGFNG